MKTKMTLQDLKDLLPPPLPRGLRVTRATNKGYRHKVNPVWLPGTPSISPAHYRRLYSRKNFDAKR